MGQSLYERLGGADAVEAIANDLVDLHLANPAISPRFHGVDVDKLKGLARDFLGAGSGGPHQYAGRSMPDSHRGMNISNDEFVAVLDDALEALDRNGVGQREKEEVLAILYSMKDEVVHR